MRSSRGFLSITFGVLAIAGAALVAQALANPSFEVASIKANKSGLPGFGGMGFQPSGRFSATRVTVRELILIAYQRQPFERRDASGGPSWIDSEQFDVEATAGDEQLPKVPELFIEQMRLRLRTLLEERFKLTVHDETRERPIYALVMARRDGKTGPQLHRSDVDCEALLKQAVNGQPPRPPEPGRGPPCSFGPAPGHMVGNVVTMAQVANVLARFVDRQIVDRTELTGSFDFELTWTPAPGESPGPGADATNSKPPADGPSLVTALQEQLGLKLESTKGPVDVLVIDHVERPTAD